MKGEKKMMKTLTFLSAVAVSAAVQAVPTVDNVRVTQGDNKVVTVTYDLKDEPAVVLAAFTTNGAPVSGEAALFCRGQVNRLVANGMNRSFTWKPRKLFPNQASASLAVKLTAFATNCPPTYLMVDLREQDRVIYFADEASLPGGSVENSLFKKDAILFFKAPARNATFRMGDAPGERSRGTRDVTHLVTFSDDFYIGVYEFTQGQYHHLTTKNFTPSGDDIPVNLVSYDQMRGSTYTWPDDGHAVAEGEESVLGRLRAKCGVEIDLPTDAQWEFACRAGTSTIWNDGRAKPAEVTDVAWCEDNSNNSGPFSVGGKPANDWRLFDFHGNVWETVLDWNKNQLTANATDPTGPVAGESDQDGGKNVHVIRGGAYNKGWTFCRAGHRNNYNPASADRAVGFRLACPATAW